MGKKEKEGSKMSKLKLLILLLVTLLAMPTMASAIHGEGDSDVKIAANQTEGTSPLTVQFSVIEMPVLSPGWTYAWDFDDGTTSSDPSPVHTFVYDKKGGPKSEGWDVYTVKVTVQDGRKDYRSQAIPIKVGKGTTPVVPILPTAHIEANRTAGYAPLDVQFTCKSENVSPGYSGNLQSQWYVEGTWVGQGKALVYNFASAKLYNITLVAQNLNGTDAATQWIEVTDQPAAPAVSFTAVPTTGLAPLTVQFTDTSTGVDGWSRTWTVEDYNDEYHPAGENLSYTFKHPGTYTVYLARSNGQGTLADNETIVVSAPPEDPDDETEPEYLPLAGFTANVSEGVAPLVVQFTDASVNALSVKWTIMREGDTAEDSSTDWNPIYFFAEPGNYTVTQTARNNDGMDTETMQIRVTSAPGGNPGEEVNPPVAGFRANVTAGVAPLAVQFNDESQNADEVIWTFTREGEEEGASSFERDPIFAFSLPGNYTVTLYALNAGGMDEKTMNIIVTRGQDVVPEPEIPEVDDAPVAQFDSNVSEGTAPLCVQFIDLSVNAESIRWYVDGKPVDSEQELVYCFESEGKHLVTLVATNGELFDSVSKVITVKEKEGNNGNNNHNHNDDDENDNSDNGQNPADDDNHADNPDEQPAQDGDEVPKNSRAKTPARRAILPAAIRNK
ncbi:MAG: hypothetical protein PHX61_07720 [Alphaproteobacteria bacterium]|nr:hypothetical protein [Alphaproteobacteria bacterium]